RCRLRPGAEHRPALEVLALGLAVQRVEVVPVEDDVRACRFRVGSGAADRLVVGVLWLQLQAHADGPGHGSCHVYSPYAALKDGRPIPRYEPRPLLALA